MTHTEKTAPEIVCLVDDDSAVLKSIGRLLASDGFLARSFDKPKDFLAHVQTSAVPVVVLDILMGEMNGLDVQAQISMISPRTRVIVITGREDAKVKEAVLRAGAVAFFSKPFDDGEFLGAVRGAMTMQVQYEDAGPEQPEARRTAADS